MPLLTILDEWMSTLTLNKQFFGLQKILNMYNNAPTSIFQEFWFLRIWLCD